MKLLKTCPLLNMVAVATIALTVVSFAFEDTTYAEYKEGYDESKMPHLILVFKGLTDGVYPWDVAYPAAQEVVEVSKEEEITIEVLDDTDEQLYVSGNDVSGNTISGNDVSGNSISGNDADKTYEFTTVDPDYFTDAVFIGDSRTVGLSEYCAELDERATFYSKVSLTIYQALTKPFIKKDDEKITVEQALSENEFGKVYIMLGLNEIGTGTPETFAEAYGEVIDQIRELQPDAIIYIQGIMHVTAHKSDNDKHFNNDNINRRNEEIAKFADNKTIFYIDMNEAVDDENGNLMDELTFDDVHLKASSYDRWYQYLLNHGIVRD